jgi:hypothetical protein
MYCECWCADWSDVSSQNIISGPEIMVTLKTGILYSFLIDASGGLMIMLD